MTAEPDLAADPQQARRAHAAMVLFAVLISTSFPVGAAITHDLDPAALTFLRFLIAAMVFAGIVQGLHGIRLPALNQLWRFALVAVSVAIFFVSQFEALRWTDTVSAGAVFTLMPMMTAAIGFLLLRQSVTRRQIQCLLLAAAAATWVLFDGSLAALLRFSLGYGELLFLGGCFVYSFYSPLIRKLHAGGSVAVFNLWVLVSGSILLGIYSAPTVLATDWVGLKPAVYLGIGYLAVFPTAGSFLLSIYASVRLPSAKVMAYTYLIPGLVVLWEALLGRGWPNLSVLVGIAAVTSATFVLQRDTGVTAARREG